MVLHTIINIFWFFGIIKLLELALRAFWFIRRQLRTTDHLPVKYGKGSWAIVTGGSDGIGLEFAKELARLGFNIVLVSRTQEKLQKAKKQIESQNNQTQVQTILFDFTKSIKPEVYQTEIVSKIQNLDISILVNNVGMIVPGDFDLVSPQEHKDQMDVNLMPATILTKLLMNQMLNRKNGLRSAILFNTSVQAVTQMAGTATYGATKVFLDYLSKALSHENRHKMDVLSFQCGLVSTNFIGKQSKTLTVITPQQAAYCALRDLGFEFQTNGHWIHEIHFHVVSKMMKWGGQMAHDWNSNKCNQVFQKTHKKQ
eukprot:403354090